MTITSSKRRRALVNYLGAVPFFLYTGIFLLLPTVLVILGSVRSSRDGSFTLNGLALLFSSRTLGIFWNSFWISAVTAIAGAIIGALLAWAISNAPAHSASRRVFVAFNSVIAQFGGVMLAFAFIATLGINGALTLLLGAIGAPTPSPGFLSSLWGIAAVYLYFQVPLMVIVFLPAIDGLAPQWREANENLGGNSKTYWLRIAAPILAPSFLGSLLLLFANSFSAFATAAALISQQTIIVPMEIQSAFRNELDLTLDSYAQSLALGMIVVIAVVMTLYALIQRRAGRWLASS
ncbi:ABC transporter permease subunit [Gulosibacter macacae]|uniref:ABC transporter permease subunit n=1 Tax=Gulosibacter macacae TaxID=2488791 RepID=A0A3P3W017_9MICO|nr:ABC transporter permease subunit [Gulosibacter macacae]RRJ88320.1 ABC transporter permease subunit [Gulosibacter macacae]